jgi:hypothetical protein
MWKTLFCHHWFAVVIDDAEEEEEVDASRWIVVLL